MYQSITTFAKKVGGPKKAILITMAGGYAVFRVGEAVVKTSIKGIKKFFSKSSNTQVFVVKETGTSNEGVKFEKGTKIKVYEIDGDSVLVEKSDEPDVPYYVSTDLLQKISDFKQ